MNSYVQVFKRECKYRVWSLYWRLRSEYLDSQLGGLDAESGRRIIAQERWMSEVKFRRIGIPEQGRGFLLVCAGQRLVLQLAARLTVESVVDGYSR